VATLTQGAVARPLNPVFGRNGLLDKYFYFSMSLLVAAIVLWGFSSTVNANLFHPAMPRPTILYSGHGVFDFVHHFFIENTGVPHWWPGFCLAFDVTLAVWLAIRLGNLGPGGQPPEVGGFQC
jgi:hypothetical protein